MIKKSIYLILILSLFFSCKPKQEKIEKYIEDGVEVVINHLDTYEIKGEPTTFTLEEEFVIDTEKDDIVELGLADIRDFNVDSEGNVYLLAVRSEENFIYKFDRNGNFVTSFGRKGQGPGEIRIALRLTINDDDELTIRDPSKNKLYIYGKNGNLAKEVPVISGIKHVDYLSNGKYLLSKFILEPDTLGRIPISIILCDSGFEEIKELDRYRLGSKDYRSGRIDGKIDSFFWSISKGNIYIGTDERGYEIWVFDLEGNLVRKIRKEFIPVEFFEELKNEIRKRWLGFQVKIDFPKHMPPFHSFFTDDEGRLFVRTFEKGQNPGEYIHDIFNADGVFIGRKSLNILWRGGIELYTYAIAKKNRIYSLLEKENGYKELVVYKMKWE